MAVETLVLKVIDPTLNLNFIRKDVDQTINANTTWNGNVEVNGSIKADSIETSKDSLIKFTNPDDDSKSSRIVDEDGSIKILAALQDGKVISLGHVVGNQEVLKVTKDGVILTLPLSILDASENSHAVTLGQVNAINSALISGLEHNAIPGTNVGDLQHLTVALKTKLENIDLGDSTNTGAEIMALINAIIGHTGWQRDLSTIVSDQITLKAADEQYSGTETKVNESLANTISALKTAVGKLGNIQLGSSANTGSEIQALLDTLFGNTGWRKDMTTTPSNQVVLQYPGEKFAGTETYSSETVINMVAELKALRAITEKLKGGTSGQILKKNSNTDYDFSWVDGGVTPPATTSVIGDGIIGETYIIA